MEEEGGGDTRGGSWRREMADLEKREVRVVNLVCKGADGLGGGGIGGGVLTAEA